MRIKYRFGDKLKCLIFNREHEQRAIGSVIKAKKDGGAIVQWIKYKHSFLNSSEVFATNRVIESYSKEWLNEFTQKL